MRIIKEGKLPNVEYVFDCRVCGCEFAVSDYELHYANSFMNKNSYKCPTCGTQVFGYSVQEIEEPESEPIEQS